MSRSAELNQIMRHVGKRAKLANAHKKFEGFPLLKIGELKLHVLERFSTRQNCASCRNNMTGIFTNPQCDSG